jgi:ParB/RepB/Spo0J family partition protein
VGQELETWQNRANVLFEAGKPGQLGDIREKAERTCGDPELPRKRKKGASDMKAKIKEIKRGQNDRQIDSRALEEAAIRTLAESIQSEGLLQPPVVTEDLELVAGFRRLAAIEQLGWPECEVRVVPGLLTETKKRIIRLTENLQRADLTAPEKSLSMVGLLELNPGWTNKELAADLHVDPSSVTRYLAYREGTAELQKAYLSGQIDLTRMYAIVKLPLVQQSEALALALSGASRDAIGRAGRKARPGNTPTVKMSKVKIALPNGASIALAGDELSMADVVELLSETLKEARKAADQYDVKTWVRMMADKAKAA